MPEVSLERFDLLVNRPDDDTSFQARVQVMEDAWALFTTRPLLGWGTGSVSVYGAGQEQKYPHNILLELAAETGLVGLGLYLAVVGMVLERLLRGWQQRMETSHLCLVFLTLVLFTLLNAMVSGDLSDNRDMWLFAGMALAVSELEP